MVANHLRKRFGDKVKVEYHDFANEKEKAMFPDIVESIAKQKPNLPLVAMDGRIFLTGQVDFWAIVEAIETRLGVTAASSEA